MVKRRTGKDAVSLLAAAFSVFAHLKVLSPSPCSLRVAYPLPTEPIFPLSTAFHAKFPFRFRAQKYRNPLRLRYFKAFRPVHLQSLFRTSQHSLLPPRRRQPPHFQGFPAFLLPVCCLLREFSSLRALFTTILCIRHSGISDGFAMINL